MNQSQPAGTIPVVMNISEVPEAAFQLELAKLVQNFLKSKEAEFFHATIEMKHEKLVLTYYMNKKSPVYSTVIVEPITPSVIKD